MLTKMFVLYRNFQAPYRRKEKQFKDLQEIANKFALIGPLLFIRASCFLAFFYQTYVLVNGMIHPTAPLVFTEEKNFSEVEFPLIFKVCVRPGFNETLVRNFS